MRPGPVPERSARSRPSVSAVPIAQSWRSFAVSPSPRPSSGSLLVAVVSVAPADPETPSTTEKVVVTATSLWFGGHSELGLAEQVTVGAVTSILTVAVAIDPGPVPSFPTPSLAVQLISWVPSPETVSGTLALAVPTPVTVPTVAPVQTIAATLLGSPAVTVPVTGEWTNQPFLPSGAGNVTLTIGGVVSRCARTSATSASAPPGGTRPDATRLSTRLRVSAAGSLASPASIRKRTIRTSRSVGDGSSPRST